MVQSENDQARNIPEQSPMRSEPDAAPNFWPTFPRSPGTATTANDCFAVQLLTTWYTVPSRWLIPVAHPAQDDEQLPPRAEGHRARPAARRLRVQDRLLPDTGHPRRRVLGQQCKFCLAPPPPSTPRSRSRTRSASTTSTSRASPSPRPCTRTRPPSST